MADGGINKIDAVSEIGRNPVSKIFNLSMENKQAGVGWDGRTCLARPNSQVQTGTGKIIQLTTSSISNLTRSIHTLL